MHTPEHGWRQAAATRSHRLIAPIIGLTLLTVGTLIYLLPSGDGGATIAATRARATATATATITAPGVSSGAKTASTSAVATPSATPSVTPTSSPTGSVTPTSRVVDVVNRTTVVHDGGTTSTVTAPGASSTAPGRTRTRTRTVTPRAKPEHCYDFTWQQDAQTAYEANLSDPLRPRRRRRASER